MYILNKHNNIMTLHAHVSYPTFKIQSSTRPPSNCAVSHKTSKLIKKKMFGIANLKNKINNVKRISLSGAKDPATAQPKSSDVTDGG